MAEPRQTLSRAVFIAVPVAVLAVGVELRYFRRPWLYKRVRGSLTR